jgi:hypothetical protein
MGAQSDFISEQFVPSEHCKAQQRLMAETIAAAIPDEETVHMSRQKIQPHLIPDGNLERCSVCGYPFPTGVRPSLSVAFAEHLLKAHRPGQTTEDSSQAALRVVREATENK